MSFVIAPSITDSRVIIVGADTGRYHDVMMLRAGGCSAVGMQHADGRKQIWEMFNNKSDVTRRRRFAGTHGRQEGLTWQLFPFVFALLLLRLEADRLLVDVEHLDASLLSSGGGAGEPGGGGTGGGR